MKELNESEIAAVDGGANPAVGIALRVLAGAAVGGGVGIVVGVAAYLAYEYITN